MSERWLTWVEPWGPNQEAVYCYAPESTVIAWAKAWAKKYHKYSNDNDALEDFIAVNWASFTEKPKDINEPTRN